MNDDDIDPDDAILAEAAYQRALELARQRNTMLEAIHLGNNIQRELAGDIPGVLNQYLKDMQERAIVATSKLVSNPLMTEEDRIATQLLIQPYAHLMHWIKDRVTIGRDARDALADLDQHLEGEGDI